MFKHTLKTRFAVIALATGLTAGACTYSAGAPGDSRFEFLVCDGYNVEGMTAEVQCLESDTQSGVGILCAYPCDVIVLGDGLAAVDYCTYDEARSLALTRENFEPMPGETPEQMEARMKSSVSTHCEVKAEDQAEEEEGVEQIKPGTCQMSVDGMPKGAKFHSATWSDPDGSFTVTKGGHTSWPEDVYLGHVGCHDGSDDTAGTTGGETDNGTDTGDGTTGTTGDPTDGDCGGEVCDGICTKNGTCIEDATPCDVLTENGEHTMGSNLQSFSVPLLTGYKINGGTECIYVDELAQITKWDFTYKGALPNSPGPSGGQGITYSNANVLTCQHDRHNYTDDDVDNEERSWASVVASLTMFETSFEHKFACFGGGVDE